MGDPKRPVNKYSTPRHPWEADRLAEEKVLTRDFGLKNKKEIWKQDSYVKAIKNHVKRLNRSVGAQAELEKDALFSKLISYNLLKEGQSLDEALELTTNDVMERRLQTQVVRQGLARTMSQARQFIIHGHIKIAGKKMTSPSYLVTTEQQFQIEFMPGSNLVDPEHPERKAPEEKAPVVTEEKSEAEKMEEMEAAEVTAKIEAEADNVEHESQADIAEETKAATEEVKNE